MKKFVIISFTVILTIGLVFGGFACPSPAPTLTPTPTSTLTPTPTRTPEVIELKFAHNSAPYQEGKPFGIDAALANYPKKIEEITNGRVKITTFPSETLLKSAEMFDGVLGGIADITRLQIHYHTSDFQLLSVFNLPGVPWTTTEARFKVMQELISEFPEMQAELRGLKILAMEDLTGLGLHVRTDKVVHVPADTEGMKIATTEIDLVKSWGAVPVTVQWTEQYMSLERGTVDATILPWGGIQAINAQEVTQTHTTGMGMGRNMCFIVMNGDVWNNLPPDVQKAFDDEVEWFTLEISRGYLGDDAVAIEKVLAEGHTIYDVTPEEFPLWAKHYEPIINQWITEREANGLPAREVHAELMRLVEKYSD